MPGLKLLSAAEVAELEHHECLDTTASSGTPKARVYKGQTGVEVVAVLRFSETSSRERAAYSLVRRFGGES